MLKMSRDANNNSQEILNLPLLETNQNLNLLKKQSLQPSEQTQTDNRRDSMNLEYNLHNVVNSTLPLVEQMSEKKAKANVDYLYYSDHENGEAGGEITFDGGVSANDASNNGGALGARGSTQGSAHNRSQSMNNLLFTSADRKAIKAYKRWNETNCQAK